MADSGLVRIAACQLAAVTGLIMDTFSPMVIE